MLTVTNFVSFKAELSAPLVVKNKQTFRRTNECVISLGRLYVGGPWPEARGYRKLIF